MRDNMTIERCLKYIYPPSDKLAHQCLGEVTTFLIFKTAEHRTKITHHLNSEDFDRDGLICYDLGRNIFVISEDVKETIDSEIIRIVSSIRNDKFQGSKFSTCDVAMLLYILGDARTWEEAELYMPKIYEYLDNLVEDGIIVKTKGMFEYGFDGIIKMRRHVRYGVKLDSGYTCREIDDCIRDIIDDTRKLIEEGPYSEQLVNGKSRPNCILSMAIHMVIVFIYSTFLLGRVEGVNNQWLLTTMLSVQMILIACYYISQIAVDNALLKNRKVFVMEYVSNKYSNDLNCILAIDKFRSGIATASVILMIVQLVISIM